VILLDTNAAIWIDRGHRRTRALLRGGAPLHLSPATILELQFLIEAGRIRLTSGSVRSFVEDTRWIVDEPAAASWFVRATELTWTRDPFDRLIAAHAQLRRWRVATADEAMIERLGPDACIAL
jgi:PIN domain nuclease of toxin-antitoxin system